ncbi:hypothetical protein [Sulfuracidifex metallicus]|uniref:Uncharacterized protein n=1 Tax=Sulfuracidifex metallicus DSM 6482 = JCM 9184 TaxID=523847 RepID=A0A6A9QY86_SULME|nr:hypothetical protein [Sulfuracidifex metallicus DSM 6482 = JCM 9184]
MPVRYICKNCGTELYKFERVGQDFYGVRTPSEIKAIFGGKCHHCGHEFQVPSMEDITFRPKKQLKVKVY